MPGKTVVTANRDLAAILFEWVGEDANILHLPLEYYSKIPETKMEHDLKSTLPGYEFIIHGNLRNARFFVGRMKENNLLKDVQNKISLAVDEPTAQFLENEKIPAILPVKSGKPIDLLEFMLRSTKEGASLYPAVEGETEEMPALLKELDMPVTEIAVCRQDKVPGSDLKLFRKLITKEPVDAILIHNRSALTRIRTAFPDLDLKQHRLISGSPGVTNKLIEEGLEPFKEAAGTWKSIRQIIFEYY